jgi:diphosphomevalonate decarboxylase
MAAICEAIQAKDFDFFACIAMQDSNQFHAVALDTDPPIFHMNDVSCAIIALIVEYNRASVTTGGKYKAAYTYDAGPMPSYMLHNRTYAKSSISSWHILQVLEQT